MLEICITNNICYSTKMSYDTMLQILNDDFISGETLVEIINDKGNRVSFKKNQVVSIGEYEEEVKT